MLPPFERKPCALGDWPIENIVGAAEVTGSGGSVHSIPFQHRTSTTDLLGSVRA